MSSRKILYFPGSDSVPGFQQLDLSDAEIAVANIDSLVYWPGMFDWDIPTSNDRFIDRVTDADCPVYGATNIASRFVNTVNGDKAYSITGPSHALYNATFDTSGSFTVGMVVREALGFGSASNAVAGGAQPWYLYSETTAGADYGKLKFVIGGVTSGAYSAYAGPVLSSTSLHRVVLIVDRVNNVIKVRVNGVEYLSIAHSSISTLNLHKELRVGVVNATGTPLGRYGHYLGVCAFNKALSGQDLADFETMLSELAA